MSEVPLYRTPSMSASVDPIVSCVTQLQAQGPSRTCNESKKEERESRVREIDGSGSTLRKREFFIDNLLVRIHFIIEMIRWTGLAPWEHEFPFPGSLASTFQVTLQQTVRLWWISCETRTLEDDFFALDPGDDS